MVVEGQGEALEQSNILSPDEVSKAINGEEGEVIVDTPTLPSDNDFKMPEKFEGKSAEEIAKAYLELEKMKNKEPEKAPKEQSKEEAGDVDSDKYIQSFIEKGELSEAEYAELAAQGHSKEVVDEQLEFLKYKMEKAEAAILGDTPKSEYLEAVVKARESWGEDKIKSFNDTLANSTLEVQQLLVKSLVTEFGKQEAKEEPMIHTNARQSQPSKGYNNRSELLADMADKRYETDKVFNQMVMNKLAATDDSNW